MGVLRDVTEERALEEQLRQAQRLESIGLLAGGVAHDFNNLLTAIAGFADLARVSAEEGDSPAPDLEQVQAAVERGRSLTSQLLTFGRRALVRPRPVDLGDAVRAPSPRCSVACSARTSRSSPSWKPDAVAVIDPGQLDQVLVNLAVNARDAMRDGGTLRIAVSRPGTGARCAPGDAPGRARRSARAGPVVLEVEDDGEGIRPELLGQIFLPFFTTKERGHGTGLGLATVQGIVAQAGGRVRSPRGSGEGTTFRVELPAVARGPRAAKPKVQRRAAAATGDGLVLLVEDEELVRRVGERVLERAGFRVVSAANVPDAMAIADRGRPDILVTDIVLPGRRRRHRAGGDAPRAGGRTCRS